MHRGLWISVCARSLTAQKNLGNNEISSPRLAERGCGKVPVSRFTFVTCGVENLWVKAPCPTRADTRSEECVIGKNLPARLAWQEFPEVTALVRVTAVGTGVAVAGQEALS